MKTFNQEEDKNLLIPILNSYWVFEHQLLAGEHPCAYHMQDCRLRLQWLLANGITSIIDLTQVHEFAESEYLLTLYAEGQKFGKKIDYYRLPVPDMAVPGISTMHQIIKTIDELSAQGQSTYIHCLGGLGRTGTVISCFLIHQGISGVKALQNLTQLRYNTPNRQEPSPETEEQRQFVLSWENIESKKMEAKNN